MKDTWLDLILCCARLNALTVKLGARLRLVWCNLPAHDPSFLKFVDPAKTTDFKTLIKFKAIFNARYEAAIKPNVAKYAEASFPNSVLIMELAIVLALPGVKVQI